MVSAKAEGREDIIKTMHRVIREAGIDRPAGGFAVFDAGGPGSRIVGRVAGLGLSDELNDKHYLVIDGTDGRVHHADVGRIPPELVPEKGMIVSVEGTESEAGQEKRTRVRILSYLPLEQLIDANGATWLDKQIVSVRREAARPDYFGAEVEVAMTCRRQWLISQNLGASSEKGVFQPVPNLLNKLRDREIYQTGLLLSRRLGLAFRELADGEPVSGIYRQSINLVSGKFAIIEKSREFSLVPWQVSIEPMKGKPLPIRSAGELSLQTRTDLSR